MTSAPRTYPDPKPARGAMLVRGVCGAALGVVMAVGIWIKAGGLGWWPSVVVGLGACGTRAFGSMRHGDAFWFRVLRRRS
ncbi:MAG TPA: hypothetical protein VF453_04995 [Burkholderiaceae bacterium]